MGGSSPTWLLFILILNFGVSWANAISCGRAWEESKAKGGLLRVIVWAAAANSAIGFSSVMMFPLSMIAHMIWPDILTNADIRTVFDLWYLTIIFPALGTGFIITIESWNVAFRTRSLSHMSNASYNTLVQTHNTMRSVDNFGSAFKSVGSLFGGKGDAKGKAIILMIIIVALALTAGIILTATLIHRYAGTVDLPKQIHLTNTVIP